MKNITFRLKIFLVFPAFLTGLIAVSAEVAGAPGNPGSSSHSPLTCTTPHTLTSSGITATSAILDWTPTGTETSWTLRYGPPGFNPLTSGTEITGITAHPYTLNPPFSSGTAYHWYVRADCDGLIQSAWSSVAGFTTSCAGTAGIPFFEDFEAGYPVGSIIGGCWSQEIIQGSGFYSNDGTYFPAYSGSNLAFLSYTGDSWLFRKIALNAGQVYDISCMGRLDPGFGLEGDGTLEIRCGTSPNSLAMIYPVTAIIDLPTGGYVKVAGSFTPTVTGDYYIGIHGSVNYRPWGIGIDDVSVTAVTCPTPAFLGANQSTGGTAVLGWGTTGAASYDIEIGLEGFTPTGSPTYTGVTNPHTVSGLSPGVKYTYYVRSRCGGGTTGAWSTPFTFKTLCGVPGDFPFSEGFESGYALNLPIGGCWTQERMTTMNSFLSNEGGYVAARTGVKNAFLYYNSSTWIMHDFHLTGGVQYAVSCWGKQDPSFGSYGDGTLAIHYGTAPEASAMTQVIVPPTVLPQTGYLNVNGTFTPPVTGTWFIGFHGEVNGFPWGIAIDDILVDVAPAVPSSLTVSNQVVTSPECFNATATITVAGGGNPFTVAAGGNANFIAGQNIRFLAGTTVVPGGTLHGSIDPGGPWCPFGESLLTGTEEAQPLSDDVPGRYRIYPNPTTGDFLVEAKNPEDQNAFKLEIFNLSGLKTLERTAPVANRQKVSLGGMPAGLYMVRVTGSSHVETLKLIKTD